LRDIRLGKRVRLGPRHYRKDYCGHVRLGSWPCQNGLRDVGPGRQDPAVSQAAIAAISGLTPTIFMTRVRL
jgi:hypothetical protein